MRTLTLITMAILTQACAPSPTYVYHPSQPGGKVDGHAAAEYVLADGHGRIQIITVGLTEMRLPEGYKTRPVRGLHVRMVVHNGDHNVWTLEALHQVAVINETHKAAPMLSFVDGKEMPLAVLEPGDTRSMDLLYELPPQLDTAAEIPGFRVDWRIDTPGRVIATRDTTFQRKDVPRPKPRPADPKATARKLVPKPAEDGMPQPGRAEATGWPSWRD